MKPKLKKVEWTQRASKSLDNYCSEIEKESPASAKKVRRNIVLAAKELSKQPNIYQQDEHYPNNPGNIRRFFRWSYRVIYQVQEKRVW